MNWPKFVGRWGKVAVSDPAPRSLSPAPGARRIEQTATVRSVPMGAGGTAPYDRDLEEAKRLLAGRTGPLYNKGGYQYLTDDDLAQLKTGSLRRRN